MRIELFMLDTTEDTLAPATVAEFFNAVMTSGFIDVRLEDDEGSFRFCLSTVAKGRRFNLNAFCISFQNVGEFLSVLRDSGFNLVTLPIKPGTARSFVEVADKSNQKRHLRTLNRFIANFA